MGMVLTLYSGAAVDGAEPAHTSEPAIEPGRIVLRARDVRFAYGVEPVLDAVDLDVRRVSSSPSWDRMGRQVDAPEGPARRARGPLGHGGALRQAAGGRPRAVARGLRAAAPVAPVRGAGDGRGDRRVRPAPRRRLVARADAGGPRGGPPRGRVGRSGRRSIARCTSSRSASSSEPSSPARSRASRLLVLDEPIAGVDASRSDGSGTRSSTCSASTAPASCSCPTSWPPSPT